MTECIIFDLSEVLIAGLIGIEYQLARELSIPVEKVFASAAISLLEPLFVGQLSEDAYLEQTIAREGWAIDPARMKTLIRANFHREVEGTLDLLKALAPYYRCVLLSDHAREWIAYITSIHSFFHLFDQTFFSYDLKSMKRDPATFTKVLDALSLSADACFFIDDSPRNVQSARSVGLPAVQFTSADQLAAELDARQLLR